MGSMLSGLMGTSNKGGANQPGAVTSGYDPNALKAAQGQLGQVNSGQNALAAALTAQMNGAGPNPALAQLNQTTAQNAEQAQAAITGQRGLNPALAAKMGADQLTAANNSAAANAATMRANQALGAQSQLAGVLGTQGQQDLGQQNAINTAQNNANQINEQQAEQNAKQSSGALGGLGSLLGAAAPIAGLIMGGPAGAMAGKAAGSILAGGGAEAEAEGGMIRMAAGGAVPGAVPSAPSGAPMGSLAASLQTGTAGPGPQAAAPAMGFVDSLKAMAAGGRVPGRATRNTGDRLRSGGAVPGKAAVKGAKDSYTNDTVAARLSPGEIVIPRHITQAPNAAAMAAKFVASVLARKGAKA